MNYILFPDKDSTIYSNIDINTGLDQILEISKDTTNKSVARCLIYFDTENIVNFINNHNILNINDAKFYLNLYTSNLNQRKLNNILYSYPVSGSWDMGTGTINSNISDGVTWTKKTSMDTWNNIGGDYHNIECSASYGYKNSDLKIDVTSIVQPWITGSIKNDGFIIKRSDSEESDDDDYGSMSFYSMDTHTIYIPFLEMAYEDYIYSPTGSNFIDSNKVVLSMPNLKCKYYKNSNIKLDVILNQSHKRKTFYENLTFNSTNYLSDNNDFYYQIQDAYNGRIMSSFSKYSKVSCNHNGYYFNLNLSGYMPERFYKITYKIISHETQSELYFDNNYVFKVIQ